MSDNPFQEEGDPEMPQLDNIQQKSASATSSSQSPSKLSKLEQLRAREAELLRRQQQIQGLRLEISPDANFPPFYPLVVYNLDNDIPPSAQLCVKYNLYSFLLMTCAAVFNVLAVLCVSGLPTYPKVRCFIFALIQGFATFYVLLHYSYEKLYASCKKRDIPFSWTITSFLIVSWMIYLSIGFPTSGSVGLATFLDLVAKSNNGFSVFIAFINMLLTGGATGFQFLSLMKAQAYQKVSGTEDTDKLLTPSQTETV
ncbi:hypothetical protein M9Y10_029429 [Tritrichomonas musculus]|uniref:Secretory carrier membrane protein n=1 Tax=Tritrichomonas musculus TaxID=1915356 RepID=A0ABR2KN82_9EUKA